ncbi:MAG TPA: signal peptide peptidase SppA [Candidatus Binataceae bacterium]|nr:signal peptide peptidase SppA [Candidatus Binataceae bacterium]
MLKRLIRWMLRLIVITVVLVVIVVVSQYLSHRYRPGSVLVLELNGPVVERGTPVRGLLGAAQVPLNVVRQSLETAAKDPRIAGLAIKVIDPDMELAQAQELADAITEFKQHGKFTTAYMETAGESGLGNLPYLVASAADEVSMMPQGEMNLLGVGMREMFARGTLDWLKIRPNFNAIGKYKSAANVFTQKNFTPAQREEDEALVGDMFEQIVSETARRRRLAPDTLRALIDRAPLMAADGLKNRLLDRLEYEDQFEDRVKEYRGQHRDLVDYAGYARPEFTEAFRGLNKIAVIYGIGAITRGQGGFDPLLSPGSSSMGSDDMVHAFNEARDDRSVRAVVFRVDSPGGSVIASELIRRAVELCAHKKPVVVSMSGFGASGGFWISTPAADIFADPGTLTGSIGVLGGKFNVAGAAAALGINTGEVSRGENADIFDAFTDFTPAQARIFHDQILAGTYQYFIGIVAKQRHMTLDQVDELAQGRVWTGVQAASNRLIDRVGGFDAALARAKILAKLDPREPVQIEELPAPPGLLRRILGGGLDGEMGWHPPAALEPLLWMMRESLARHSALGEAYCPLVPVM